MARSIDRRFYESTEWKRCKEVYLEKVNHLCERCLAKGIYEPAKIVHHKVYLTSETFKEDFMSLDAKDRLLVITKLVEFVIPKYQSTSIDISVNEKKTIEDQLLTLAEDDE